MDDRKDEHNQEFHPRGTLLVLAIFVLTIIVLWGSVYIILLERGVTQ